MIRITPTGYPPLLSVHLVEKCNFRCRLCHTALTRAHYRSATDELNFESIEKLVFESKGHRTAVRLHGGEPLLYSRFVDTVRMMRDNSLPCSVTTNGLLLEDFAEDIVQAGLQYLTISLDGWDRESQALRGRVDSFDRIIKGIEKVRRCDATLPMLQINTLVTDVNYSGLVKVYHLVRSLGIARWRVVNLSFMTADVEQMCEDHYERTGIGHSIAGARIDLDNYLNHGALMELGHQIETIKRENDDAVQIEFRNFELDLFDYYSTKMPSSRSFCSGIAAMEVRGNGDLCICTSGYRLGNISADSIAQVWRHGRIEHFRRLYEGSFPMPICYRCCALHASF